MVSDGKKISVAHADRVGKVFVAMAQGMRKCSACDGVFARQGAGGARWDSLLPAR
jgi:hypothetical protein